MATRLRLLLPIALGLAILAACGNETPPVLENQLEVTVVGNGAVSSSPAGIDLDAAGTATADYAVGTVVTLTAEPDAGYVFEGWGGICSGTALTCAVTMNTDHGATATFVEEVVEGDAALTVDINPAGTSAGFVTSSPAGIDADTTTAEFPIGSEVVLTAEATEGFFTGWTGGDCDGVSDATCTVTINQNEPTVTANFSDVDTQVVTVSVADGADDAEEFLADSISADPPQFLEGFTYNTSSDLELSFDPAHAQQLVGLRFTGIAVPAGAEIVSATLSFTAETEPGTAGPMTVTIRAQASDQPAAFTQDTAPDASFDISTRTLTAASADWTIDEAWTADTVYTSVDLATVVQEVVDLAEWAEGDALAFVIDGPDTEEYRRAYSYDAVPVNAPTLRIEYAMPTVPAS